MNESQTLQHSDVASVGTRVSWGAICAGSVLALSICLLLTTLGMAVGVSVHDRLSTSTIHTGSVMWAVLIVCASLFVGGMATSLLTSGENHTEAVIHGILTWGMVLAIFSVLGALGIRNGFNVTGRTDVPGLTAVSTSTPSENPNEKNVVEKEDTRKRYVWFSFAGTWLSMLAAALGAYLGAGPTFRLVIVPRTRVLTPPSSSRST